MNTTPEIWKPVPGFTDVFASSLGYIKRRDFRRCRHHARPAAPDKWIVNLGAIDGRGYYSVTLSVGLRAYTRMKTHRLVALAFIPNPNDFGDVNHKNGIKIDNRPENLEWCTRGHNNRHAFDTGLREMPKGIDHSSVVLSEAKVREIYNDRVMNHLSYRKLGCKHGINPGHVWAIANGKLWKHLNLGT